MVLPTDRVERGRTPHLGHHDHGHLVEKRAACGSTRLGEILHDGVEVDEEGLEVVGLSENSRVGVPADVPLPEVLYDSDTDRPGENASIAGWPRSRTWDQPSGSHRARGLPQTRTRPRFPIVAS